MSKIECDGNCLECPYPDVPQECLDAPLTWEEYRLDKVFVSPKTLQQRKVAAQQRAWYEANREKVAAQQRWIAVCRKRQGMTQTDLAARIGVAQPVISRWETGSFVANWDKLCAVLPELERYRPADK